MKNANLLLLFFEQSIIGIWKWDEIAFFSGPMQWCQFVYIDGIDISAII